MGSPSPASGLVALAHHRSQCYRYLARGFQQPTEATLALLLGELPLGSIAEMVPVPFLRALGAWQREVSAMQEQEPRLVLKGLQGRYLRLFVGPYHQYAPPYESLYTSAEGLLMGEAAARVQQEYERAGLTLAATFRDLPDHIAVELEFMGFLCASEASSWRAQEGLAGVSALRRERAFLSEHLTRWLPLFLGRLRQSDDAGLYVALGELTLSFTQMDRDWCTAWLHVLQEASPKAGGDNGHGP